MGEQRSIKDHDAASVLLAERDRQREIAHEPHDLHHTRWLHAEAAFERDRQREIAEDWRKLHAELEAGLRREFDRVGELEAEVKSWKSAWRCSDLAWAEDRAELARERASRQDWAAEATRLSWINEVHGSCVLSDELHPRVCACISDEHAAQLGPAFSRPVCAVHPEVRP